MNRLRVDRGLSSVEEAVLKRELVGYTGQEYEAAITQMQHENKLMVADDTIFFMG